MAHGGKREGSGRKPKADEIRIAEAMDKTSGETVVLEILWPLVQAGELNAIKLWLSYRYGQPTQVIEDITQQPRQLVIVSPKHGDDKTA